MADPEPPPLPPPPPPPPPPQQQPPQPTLKEEGLALVSLPRVMIRFCTACKWNLRAAYYAQELLQTFAATLGEVALVPASAGVFEVAVYLPSVPSVPFSEEGDDGNAGKEEVTGKGKDGARVLEYTIWNRKTDGGFPETKELKRRVRNLVDRERGLGHVDRDYSKKNPKTEEGEGEKGNREESLLIQGKEKEKGEDGSGSGEPNAADVANRKGKEGCDDCK